MIDALIKEQEDANREQLDACRQFLMPAELHPDTAALIVRFSVVLGYKLLRAQEKYGRTIEWMVNDWEMECKRDLLEHVVKGDPLDVAAYAVFCWARGWTTTPPPTPLLVALDLSDEEISALAAVEPGVLMPVRKGNITDTTFIAAVDRCAQIARDVHDAEIRRRDEALGEKNHEGALTRARQAQTAEAIEERIRELANIDPNGPVTGNQLRDILGIEPEDPMDAAGSGEIQTCSGTWRKDLGTGLWRFEEDEIELEGAGA